MEIDAGLVSAKMRAQYVLKSAQEITAVKQSITGCVHLFGRQAMRPSGALLVGIVKLLVGAYPRWIGCQPTKAQRIYFANHSSHVDTIALWSALPIAQRHTTHAVAARDYWGKGFRKYIATKALRAVLIERAREDRTGNPLEPLIEVLQRGESLIVFPEGTRGTEPIPARFKSGLYRLAMQFPQVELIPVYLDNLHRSMPKGAVLPIPMTCTVRFGAPMSVTPNESKDAFLVRARDAVIALSGRTATETTVQPTLAGTQA
jgi:1-acyl-sn-glycerol-3-phosphate acyltransferase